MGGNKKKQKRRPDDDEKEQQQATAVAAINKQQQQVTRATAELHSPEKSSEPDLSERPVADEKEEEERHRQDILALTRGSFSSTSTAPTLQPKTKPSQLQQQQQEKQKEKEKKKQQKHHQKPPLGGKLASSKNDDDNDEDNDDDVELKKKQKSATAVVAAAAAVVGGAIVLSPSENYSRPGAYAQRGISGGGGSSSVNRDDGGTHNYHNNSHNEDVYGDDPELGLSTGTLGSQPANDEGEIVRSTSMQSGQAPPFPPFMSETHLIHATLVEESEGSSSSSHEGDHHAHGAHGGDNDERRRTSRRRRRSLVLAASAELMDAFRKRKKKRVWIIAVSVTAFVGVLVGVAILVTLVLDKGSGGTTVDTIIDGITTINVTNSSGSSSTLSPTLAPTYITTTVVTGTIPRPGPNGDPGTLTPTPNPTTTTLQPTITARPTVAPTPTPSASPAPTLTPSVEPTTSPTNAPVCFGARDGGLLTCGCHIDNQESFRGTRSPADRTTVNGQTCVAWPDASPDDAELTSSADPDPAYCRNPDGLVQQAAWCYTNTSAALQEDWEWSYCDIPWCLDSADSDPAVCGSSRIFQSDYRGTINVTATGQDCVAWDRFGTWFLQHYPRAGLASGENYCRNPDNRHDGAWCFHQVTTVDPVTNTTQEQYLEGSCNVPTCGAG